MKKVGFYLYRGLIVLLSIVNFFIFFGLIFQGFIQWKFYVVISDLVFIAFFIVTGLIVCLMSIDAVAKILRKDAYNRTVKRFHKQKYEYVTTLFIFLFLILVQNAYQGLLPYIGHVIGRFFILNARNAYMLLFHFDIEFLFLFAWFFEWIFVQMIVQLFFRMGKKVYAMVGGKK